MDRRVRVLSFLDNSLGRDTEIILPVAYCLEEYLNVDVQYKFVWDLLYIKTWKPDVVLLPNVRGHHMYVEAAKFSKKNNITVLALDSEGNFPRDSEFNIWGYNTERSVYQDWIACWSEKAASYIRKRVETPDKEKIIVTGGTGFDRYRFGKARPKSEFLLKYNLQKYDKVIGYAGWAFGKLYNSQRESSFGVLFPDNREKGFQWAEDQRIFVRDALKKCVQKNPDVLFIFKKHPKEEFEDELKEGKNEMNELLHFKNTLYLKNEEPIQDIIGICDIWMGFETTTLIEAWMLKKTTIIINNDTNFPRSTLYKGSIIANSGIELETLIAEYYKRGSLKDFISPTTNSNRSSAIKDSIGFSDGLNHIRAFLHFRKSIPTTYGPKSVSLNLRHLRLYLLMNLGKFFYVKSVFKSLPKFKKTIYVFENHKLPGFQERKQKVYAQLEIFHQKEGIRSELLNNNWKRLESIL